MAKIPVRFKRVAAAFDEIISRARPCSESSGSEHSAVDDDSPDLSDLVESFIEDGDDYDEAAGGGDKKGESKITRNDSDSDKCWSDSDTKEMLQSLFSSKDREIRRIREETDRAWRLINGSSSSSLDGFKRDLMTRLRERGFDAGLCKSRWEKTGRYPAGTFEYVDVVIGANRYIVEVSFAGEFTIARSTPRYLSLLEVFPKTFVGKPDKLKQVVRLMCSAAKESLKSSEMLVAPWRRNGYMQAKWLSSYKRTTNSAHPTKNMSDSDSFGADRRSVIGFSTMPVPKILYSNCRSDDFFGGRGGGENKGVHHQVGGMKVGQLAQALNGIEL